MCACVPNHFSYVRLFATLWTVARQTLLSMGFSRPEYWSGLPCPPPGDLPHPGMEPEALKSPALAGRFFTASASWEAYIYTYIYFYILHTIYTHTSLYYFFLILILPYPFIC